MSTTTATIDLPAPPLPGDTGPGDVAGDLRERAVEFEQSLRHLVVEHPVVAIAAALTGGFLIGRLLQRL